MKVLFCLPDARWGCPDREPVKTLADALRGHGEVAISFIQFSRDVSEIAHETNRTVIPCRRSLSQSILDRFQRERKAMATEIRRQQPDLVHVHWTQLGHALAAMDSGIPYVVTVHDAALTCAYWNWSWSPPSALAGLGGLLITRKILRHANHIIAVSPYVASHVKRFFLGSPHSPPGENLLPNSSCHIPQSSISVIPNPVSLPESSGLSSQSSNASPVFTAIGHWGPLKNFDLVLKAFALVQRRIPSAKLVLIGKDLGEGTPCYAWSVRRGLEGGVDFRGQMAHADLSSFLANDVDCLLHPSRTEGFSLVVADAMSARVPVIASSAGALPWLLGEGACGTLVKSQSPGPWAEAMLAATIGKASPSKLDRARERIARLCDPREIAAQHTEIYTRIVRQASG